MLKFAKRNGIKTFLWSCSIGKENMDDEMIDKLMSYDMIFPRECITYGNLIRVGIPRERLFQMSDSAFVLDSKEIDLPDSFENVVAYNPSYSLGKKCNQDIIAESRIVLLKYLLHNTDMKIALVPHVYANGKGDDFVCRQIADSLNCPERVFVFEKELLCEELKYLISRCRFLIAERTHASIAGYSQLVPTFVIGYSVKSSGIAADLFGKGDKYVLPSTDINETDDLINPIMEFISKEHNIRNVLERVVPEYKLRTVEAAHILSNLLV